MIAIAITVVMIALSAYFILPESTSCYSWWLTSLQQLFCLNATASAPQQTKLVNCCLSCQIFSIYHTTTDGQLIVTFLMDFSFCLFLPLCHNRPLVDCHLFITISPSCCHFVAVLSHYPETAIAATPASEL